MEKTLILHDGKYKKISKKYEKSISSTSIMNTMTAITTGEVTSFANGVLGNSFIPFNGKDNGTRFAINQVDGIVGQIYKTEKVLRMYKIVGATGYQDYFLKEFYIEGSKNTSNGRDGDWSILDYVNDVSTNIIENAIDTNIKYKAFRLRGISNQGASDKNMIFSQLYFYETIIKEVGSTVNTVFSDLPTTEQFLSDGMDSLSLLLDRKVTALEPLPMSNKSEILIGNETGKVFSKTLNLKKFMDLRSIKGESLLFKIEDKLYSLKSGTNQIITEISSISKHNFVNYGTDNAANLNDIQSNKKYNLNGNGSLESPSLVAQLISRKPLSINCVNKFILKNPITNKYYAHDGLKLVELNDTSTISTNGITDVSFTTSDYDYISETPQVIVYTESTDDITVSTTTEPYDLYDEFGDELEVLYYTDDEAVTEADLILEANWSPIDELEGDFEVVTWTDEEDSQRVLEMTAIPKAQFVYSTTINDVSKLEDIIVSDLSTHYKSQSPAKLLFTPNNTDWYYFNKTSFVKVTPFTMENVKLLGNTIEEISSLTSTQLNKWNFDTVNVGVYLEDDIRGIATSKVSDIVISNLEPNDTSTVSETSFYILNTTARIDIDLQGMSVFGTVSDDDMTRVQYRVKLNGEPYFPIDGNFTALSPSPQSISLNFTSDQIKIDDWNDVEVEFQDFFGTTDTWATKFVGRYAGIMFTDENGELYSTDVGQVLKYLDFGTVLTGQITPIYAVKLKNQYGFDVKDVNIQANTSDFAEGLQLDFSLDSEMNGFSDKLEIPSMKNEDEILFYLRMRSPITTEPNGHNLFDIFVSAKRDV